MAKRLFAALLVLLWFPGLLAGCTSGTLVRQDELTIRLPKGYTDLSDAPFAGDAHFLYGMEDGAILGIREDKTVLAEHGMSPTLAQYAAMVVEANGINAEPALTDGFCHFTYQSRSQETALTYLTVILEGETCFWMLQAYCPTSVYPANRDAFWSCLTSAKLES